MERPSHSITALQVAAAPRRMTVMGFSVGVQLAFLSMFVLGIATSGIIEKTHPIIMSPVKDEVTPKTPPPLPADIKPVLPSVAPPLITTFDPPAGNGGITTTTTTPEAARPVPVIPPPQPPVAAVPDRSPALIPETRSNVPYPTLERRLGIEGRVVLRLTIQPDGRIGQAAVEKSSGRSALDRAAQDWITANWKYRPAMRNGAAATAQALAAVEFVLTNP